MSRPFSTSSWKEVKLEAGGVYTFRVAVDEAVTALSDSRRCSQQDSGWCRTPGRRILLKQTIAASAFKRLAARSLSICQTRYEGFSTSPGPATITAIGIRQYPFTSFFKPHHFWRLFLSIAILSKLDFHASHTRSSLPIPIHAYIQPVLNKAYNRGTTGSR